MRSLRAVLGSNHFLIATLTLAAGVRVAHVMALRSLPLFDQLILDSAAYDFWARRIAAGDWLSGDRVFYQDPLYPYLLAGLYWLFGRDLLLVRLVHVVFSVGTCALVATIGWRVAGRAVGNVAALFVALYRPAIYHDGEIEKTALGVFLVTAAMALAIRSTRPAYLGAGAMLGLAALTRGNILVFGPLGALVFFLEREDHGAAEGAAVGPSWRRRARCLLSGRRSQGAILFLVGFYGVLAPVAWRNHHVSGEWILATSQAGQNFYIGNNPWNRTGSYDGVPFVRANPLYEQRDFQAVAEVRTGRHLTASEVSSYWFAESWRLIQESPGIAMRGMLRKLALFWADYEAPDAWDFYFLANYSPILGLPLPTLGWLLPLGLVGAITAFRAHRAVRLLAGFAVFYAISTIVFFVFSRYRIHVLPPVAVLASLGAAWLWRVGRARDLRRAAVPVALALALAVFAFTGPTGARLKAQQQNQSFINLAGLYQRSGDLDRAERTLNEAALRVPGDPSVVCERGRLQLGMGRLSDALEGLTRCVALKPDHPEIWLALGQVLEGLGRPTEAIDAYRQQLRFQPADPRVEFLLAVAELKSGDAARAANRLAALVERSGNEPQTLLHWAVALLALGREEEAQAVVDRAATAGFPISSAALTQAYQRLVPR